MKFLTLDQRLKPFQPASSRQRYGSAPSGSSTADRGRTRLAATGRSRRTAPRSRARRSATGARSRRWCGPRAGIAWAMMAATSSYLAVQVAHRAEQDGEARSRGPGTTVPSPATVTETTWADEGRGQACRPPPEPGVGGRPTVAPRPAAGRRSRSACGPPAPERPGGPAVTARVRPVAVEGRPGGRRAGHGGHRHPLGHVDGHAVGPVPGRPWPRR